ncbi:Piwi domain-containing protein [Clostridium saudiense]|uniref:Piwi domain-containing protein n=1 Tax=Clostridium saudiense TaxID=1414720 RepID=UPI0012B74CEE|nr:Piwi domain-containing protein [Clostridium saudiense]
MNNLTLEAFRGIGTIKPLLFYRYKLIGKGKIENTYKTIRNAQNRMSFNNKFKATFSKDEIIYTLEKFEIIPTLDDVTIIFDGEEVLPIKDNNKIYSEVIEFYINNNLRNVKFNYKYPKYRAANTREITGNVILDKDMNEKYKKSNKGFELKRKFIISPKVDDEGKVTLFLDLNASFDYDKNIYQMIKAGIDVVGEEVINIWSNKKQRGKIKEISDIKINEPCNFGQSLIDYYISSNQASRVNGFTEEEKNTNVIIVESGKSRLSYIPHALKPIITREYIAKNDEVFSKEIEGLIKINMNYRYEILKRFVSDIGTIKELNNLRFEKIYMDNIESLGYEQGQLKDPVLIGGKGILKDKIHVFKSGFYKSPNDEIKFGVIYPRGYIKDTQSVIRAIYDFCTEGKYQRKDNIFINNKLMNIKFSNKECVFEEYELNDITEYKRAANKLKKNENIKFVIAIIPTINESDIENPYNPFKRVCAEINLPSQMISLKTAKRFSTSRGQSELYFLHNISLGILGKIGGVPWVIKDMPGEVDCFVGLDVGTKEKGIHYPACSVLFDKYGKLINYYKPTIPQSGEIIKTDVLQEIFDKVLLSYEEENGQYPRNIVIHRDGFSREDLEWYKNYFLKKNIEFSIVEVRKNFATRLVNNFNDEVSNPSKGSFILRDNEAIVVTTDINDNMGAPKPIKVEKTYGDIDMLTIINQIYALTQIHVGSAKSLRLPITTGYADKICKAIDYIPSGQVDNRLFFL